MMALNRHQNKERDRRTDKTHRVGSFLFNYFRGEGLSIQFLEDLTVKLINSLTIEQQRHLIMTKPKPDAWGPAIRKADDMWEYVKYLSQFWVFEYDPPVEYQSLSPVTESLLHHPLSPHTVDLDMGDLMDLDDAAYLARLGFP